LPGAVIGPHNASAFALVARKQIQDPRVSFRLGDAQRVQVESASYDADVSALVLNFVPQPTQAVSEMVRTVRTGGTVAAYVWDYADKMQERYLNMTMVSFAIGYLKRNTIYAYISWF